MKTVHVIFLFLVCGTSWVSPAGAAEVATPKLPLERPVGVSNNQLNNAKNRGNPAPLFSKSNLVPLTGTSPNGVYHHSSASVAIGGQAKQNPHTTKAINGTGFDRKQ
jgi:hypothetical protein